MKDIENFNSELEEVIDTSIETFDTKKEIKKHFIMDTAILVCGAMATFGFDIMPFDFSSLAIFIASGASIEAVLSTLAITNKKKVIRREIDAANDNIDNVIYELSKSGIKTEKAQVKDAVVEVESTSKTKVYDADNMLKSKEEKIIKYFYLLDEKDQIRVLKQISTNSDVDKDVIYNHSLALMEDEDLIDKEIPVYKTLKLKKDMGK